MERGRDGGGASINGQVDDAASVDSFFVVGPTTDVVVRQGDTACVRSVNLMAVSISRPVPFDVVIVADNSDSLSWSRSSLSAGLENLLSRVHGHQARFFVLTSTQYGASSEAAVSPFTGKELVSWRDSITRVPYAHPMTEYKQRCTDRTGAPIACPAKDDTFSFNLDGTWDFKMPPPVAAIDPTMTAAQLTVQQRRIADAILALGGGGAQQEQPLCTLSRYIAQRADLLPKHVVFVVLSDEDDTSLPAACLARYHADRVVSTTGNEHCTANCPEYVYYTSKPSIQEHLHFRCVPVDDMGVAHPERAMDKSLTVSLFATCTGNPGGDCTAGDLAKAGNECGGGHLVRNCKRTCGPVPNASTGCSVTRNDDSVDLCKQPFDHLGMRWANLIDYCTRSFGPGWEDCHVSGIMPGMQMSTGYSERATPLVSVATTAEMITTFKRDASRIWGPRAHSIEAIILDPAFSCPVQPGQSHAANLRQLASSPQDVFPLCQDYAPALQRVQDFAEHRIQTEFPLTLDNYEDIDSVTVTNRAGIQRTIGKTSFTYDRAARILRFHAGVLTAQDAGLAVNVTRHCEPVVK